MKKKLHLLGKILWIILDKATHSHSCSLNSNYTVQRLIYEGTCAACSGTFSSSFISSLDSRNMLSNRTSPLFLLKA
ncbi:hypothetical protein Y032_0387g461 [Ancylostoma ceylanicum]|uniref:Secreted protein n=1 Tax=Ancylostoma ceylanicum TaxID=53326 RepID=A0A016RSK9_9BILA|nr:hypothetical protein Y032_0387g461 [Ancylostoma ceylanicum]